MYLRVRMRAATLQPLQIRVKVGIPFKVFPAGGMSGADHGCIVFRGQPIPVVFACYTFGIFPELAERFQFSLPVQHQCGDVILLAVGFKGCQHVRVLFEGLHEVIVRLSELYSAKPFIHRFPVGLGGCFVQVRLNLFLYIHAAVIDVLQGLPD